MTEKQTIQNFPGSQHVKQESKEGEVKTPNVFDEMEQEGQNLDETAPVQVATPAMEQTEIDYETLSDTPVGELVKYNRESLHDEIVTIESAKVFPADTSNPDNLTTAMDNKDVKYYRCRFLVTYDKKNSEGVFHREYFSGVSQFVQKDGTLSPLNFWYKKANNQISHLWELVAKFKGKEPSEISAKEFMAFLNSKPKVKIDYTDVDTKVEKYKTKKNFIKEFIK